ncbi:hypothetical protein K439DRAFT_1148535 [Ramaria rubella]|nr:hypothetical protein K439DRAFT_1148535 [Ramaria rubella]
MGIPVAYSDSVLHGESLVTNPIRAQIARIIMLVVQGIMVPSTCSAGALLIKIPPDVNHGSALRMTHDSIDSGRKRPASRVRQSPAVSAAPETHGKGLIAHIIPSTSLRLFCRSLVLCTYLR